MALPEEILRWIIKYDDMPKRYSIGFIGSATADDQRNALVASLSRYYPDAILGTTEIPSANTPQPNGRLSRDRYYKTLQQCRVVLSLPGAGFDTFRFWEHAACNALHVAPRVPLFIPNPFQEGEEICHYNGTADDLRRTSR